MYPGRETLHDTISSTPLLNHIINLLVYLSSCSEVDGLPRLRPLIGVAWVGVVKTCVGGAGDTFVGLRVGSLCCCCCCLATAAERTCCYDKKLL